MKKRFGREILEEPREKVLDVDASMQGTLSFHDPVNLRINGKFEGRLNAKGTLTIGENAAVNAEITGDQITIGGRVTGNIHATRELRLNGTAVVLGNVDTPILVVQEGAAIDGTIRMKSQGSAEVSKQFLSIDEVADYLEIEKALVVEWADNGKLPAVKDNDKWRFDRSLLDRWVANEKIN
ncbi:MAG: polymer-forming cytoskeletal protein [Candidatus Omnitrophica bacterium]|nr:polymer-forming cytoskeletal protein [Candidatus Omnitrophota bacterium]